MSTTTTAARAGQESPRALAPAARRIGPLRRAARGLGRFGALCAIFLLVYALAAVAARPRFTTWGTTGDEAGRPLPGDELVARPDGQSTLAVTIRAPAEQVYPWLLQLGQGRGGLYSYDFLENLLGLDMHSADRILPEFQQPQVGEPMGYGPAGHPAASISPRFVAFDKNRAVLLMSADDTGSWAFVLVPREDGATRLLLRTRGSGDESFVSRLVFGYLFDPLSFAMTRKMLLGIQARAEGTVLTPVADAVEVLLWMAAFVAFFVARFGVFGRRDRRRHAAVAGAALATFLVLLIGRPPVALGVIATAGLVGAVAWAYRPAAPPAGAAMTPPTPVGAP